MATKKSSSKAKKPVVPRIVALDDMFNEVPDSAIKSGNARMILKSGAVDFYDHGPESPDTFTLSLRYDPPFRRELALVADSSGGFIIRIIKAR